jgi:glycosyltransferase involved in cell wall biosynthesis
MTEVQSLLIAPFCKLLKVKHYLWYAHKSKSPYLRFSYPFLSGIITSTFGSCPLKGPKVHAIGQAIDTRLFDSTNNLPQTPPLRWYHIGRLDESKNIHIIIEAFQELRRLGWDITLDLYGEPSFGRSSNYFQTLLRHFNLAENAVWLRFHGSINRSKIPQIAQSYDGFVHAFDGSIDKALLEAVMCRRVIVSTNSEFLLEFESRNRSKVYNEIIEQMEGCLKLSQSEHASRINRYWQIAALNHSLDKWIEKTLKVLLLE